MTIESLWQNQDFQKHLVDGIKIVKDNFINNKKSNPFQKLDKKGYLSVTILKYEFAQIMAKKSRLSSNE